MFIEFNNKLIPYNKINVFWWTHYAEDDCYTITIDYERRGSSFDRIEGLSFEQMKAEFDRIKRESMRCAINMGDGVS